MKRGLLILLIAGSATIADGVSAFRERRFSDAHRIFLKLDAEAGSHAPASLAHDRALAALRAGALDDVMPSIERAILRGGPEFEPLRTFLAGNVAFERCLSALAMARLPEAGPDAFALAEVEARKAFAAWSEAAARRGGWPEAARNAERALRRLEALREEAEKARKAAKKERAAPEAKPTPPEPGEEAVGEEEPLPGPEEAPPLDLILHDLPAHELSRLLERLATKDKEKKDARRTAQSGRPALGGRDW